MGGAGRGSRGRAVGALEELIEALPDETRSHALTHSSWVSNRTLSWGRLAFLGDSILGLVVAEALYERLPRADIGRLTKVHGQAVSGRACAEVAFDLGVEAMLESARPEQTDGGIDVADLLDSERAMASVTEALIGACYMSAGIEATGPAVLAAFEPQIALASETLLDFKSALQERLARSGSTVSYRVVRHSGPPHDRTFAVQATTDGRVLGEGAGPSKKAAEQSAAAKALQEEPD